MAKSKPAKPMKDRFLTNEKPENLYLTFALYFVMVFTSLLLIFVYLVAMCEIDGTSMAPTLENGQNVLLEKNPSSFKIGDVITFKVVDPVDKSEKSLIKRVIGVAGDEIVFIERGENSPYVDMYRKENGSDKFQYVDESGYILEDMLLSKTKVEKFKNNVAPSASPENMEKHKITIDEDTLVVMGDNRNDSADSRRYGAIPVNLVQGKMFYELEKGSILERLLLLIYSNRENHG